MSGDGGRCIDGVRRVARVELVGVSGRKGIRLELMVDLGLVGQREQRLRWIGPDDRPLVLRRRTPGGALRAVSMYIELRVQDAIVRAPRRGTRS